MAESCQQDRCPGGTGAFYLQTMGWDWQEKKWRKVPPGPVLLQRSRGGGLIQRIFQRDIFAGTNVCCSRKKSFLSSYLPPPLPSLTSFLRSNINAVKCINYFLAWQKFKYVYTLYNYHPGQGLEHFQNPRNLLVPPPIPRYKVFFFFFFFLDSEWLPWVFLLFCRNFLQSVDPRKSTL